MTSAVRTKHTSLVMTDEFNYLTTQSPEAVYTIFLFLQKTEKFVYELAAKITLQRTKGSKTKVSAACSK